MIAAQRLLDTQTGERRYAVSEMLHDGRNFEFVSATDSLAEDRPVVLKAIKYEGTGAKEIAGRRAQLALEIEALSTPSILLPEPLDRIHTSNPDIGALDPDASEREPLLVLDHIPGVTLTQYVEEHAEHGLSVPRALAIARRVAHALEALHERDFVLRCLSPDHIMIDVDDAVMLVGIGNVARRAQRPTRHKVCLDERYSAPEILHEVGGIFITPRADLYSFGALLAFMCTGQHPTAKPESPFTATAYAKLQSLPEGLRCVIAHCMQPLHKKRFARMRRMIPFLHVDTLPAVTTEGFTFLELMQPWDGADLKKIGSLTPGPLVSRPNGASQTHTGEDHGHPAHTDPTSEEITAAPLEESTLTAAPQGGPPMWRRVLVPATLVTLALIVMVLQLLK